MILPGRSIYGRPDLCEEIFGVKIVIISGFLGAGKTTFIKSLINNTGIHPVILENEYGENNLDSLDIQQNAKDKKEVKILEFMEGCVCCSMKDSFVNSVFTIYSSLNPEYLIIEPTGVGMLGNIIDSLKPLLNSEISLLKPVVVVSPESFYTNMKKWPELYENQIRNAQRVVFSKCEHLSAEDFDRIEKEIKKINITAEVAGTHYKNMDKDWWKQLINMESEVSDMGNISNDSDREKGTGFQQISINKAGFHNLSQLIQFLEDCVRAEFGNVVRAKGTLWVDTDFVRFDLADNMYAITGNEADSCQCVIIGENLDEKRLRARLRPENCRTIAK